MGGNNFSTGIRPAILPVLLLLAGLLFTGAAPSAGVAAELPVRVLVNDRAVDFPGAQPFIDEKGRVQVPVRFVARELGARVAWDEASATACISGHGKSIALAPGQNTATVNGTAVSLDSGAVLIEDRIYVPARFIAGALGAAVRWDEGAGEVGITMDQPVISDFGISYLKDDAVWRVIPRTFTAWVQSNNAKRVDFYLTPTGTGQEPVKISSSHGSGGHFRITYTLPRESVMAHFWAVAVNDKGEESTEHLNVYRDAGAGPVQKRTEFGDLALTGYGHDLRFAPDRKAAVFSGYSFTGDGGGGEDSKLLLLDIAKGTITVLDEGKYFRAIGWDTGGKNVLYMKNGSLYRLSLKDGGKAKIAENSYYGAFSPDGRLIAYVQENNGLWVCGPDGQHLFFFNDLGKELGDGAGRLQGMARIAVADGGVEQLFPEKTGKFRSAEWITQGRSLHVISGWDDGFYEHIADLTTGRITDLGENFGNMNYTAAVDSAAGRLLQASSAGTFQLYDAAGNKIKSLSLGREGWRYHSAAFAPDGRDVLVMSGNLSVSGEPAREPERRDIAVIDTEKGNYRILAEGGENYEACFWGTGGGEVLILEKSAGGPSAGLTGFTIITVNQEKPQDGDDIFVPVREQDLTGEERAFVEGIRRNKGVHHKGGLYVVALGECPNPGYGLEVVKTELSWEQAKVYVRLTKPEPGKFYAAVISYPGLVGRVSLPPYTNISFIDVDTGESLHQT